MVKKPSKATDSQTDPESQQKKYLKTLAVTNRLLSRNRPSVRNHLAPSANIQKLDGHDIVKRGGQRKTRFLFSFPGLIGNFSGGRVGELADLGSKNPVLYLEFPNGRMKLFGTHVYPKNKYLTLQLTRSTKGVQCEDCFESLIVFSDAWWIGSKEENPEEHKLQFPEDINEDKPVDPNFKGGAGATFEETSAIKKPMKENKENKARSLSPDTETDDDMDEDSYPLMDDSSKKVLETTPVRQSARMAGKTFNFAASFGNDSTDSEDEKPDIKDQIDAKTDTDNAFKRSLCELDNCVPTTSSFVDDKNMEQSLSLTKSENFSEVLPNKKGTLVQATLSTLFAKASEKKSTDIEDTSLGLKDSADKRRKSVTSKKNGEVKGSTKKEPSPGRKKSGIKTASVRKRLHVVSDDELDEISSESQVKGASKKESSSCRKKSGTRTVSVRKQSQVVSGNESDEISSEPQDDSDDDWAA